MPGDPPACPVQSARAARCPFYPLPRRDMSIESTLKRLTGNDSMTQPTSSADDVAWDLGDLYAGPDDPRLDARPRRGPAPRRGVRDGLPRQDRHRRRPGADLLLAALRELESLSEQMDRPRVYAGLLHAAKTDDPKHGALLSRTREQRTAINKHLIFFDLEWVKLADEPAQALIAVAGAGEVPPLPRAEARLAAALPQRAGGEAPRREGRSPAAPPSSACSTRPSSTMTFPFEHGGSTEIAEPAADPRQALRPRPQRAPGGGRRHHPRACRRTPGC